MIWCPACGGEEFVELPVLGSLVWLRCRFCGLDLSAEDEEVQQ